MPNSSSHETPRIRTDLDQILGRIGVNPAMLTPISESERRNIERTNAQEARKRERLEEWQGEVERIKSGQDAMRTRMEESLKSRVEAGHVETREAAAAELDRIDTAVSRGIPSSYTFNASSDPRYNKSQTYFASVDEQGNIWGDFVFMNDPGLTGKPLPAGRHLMMPNPMLEQ